MADQGHSSDSTTPQKRGRGRPRKDVPGDSLPLLPLSKCTPQKRSRGRPQKKMFQMTLSLSQNVPTALDEKN